MSESNTKTTNSANLRERKIVSRNSESSVTNTIMYILVKQLGATISFRKTKKTKNTIKMMIPESIILEGNNIDQNGIIQMNELFIREVMKEEPIKIEGLNDKQYNRSKEAWINNGLLYLLKSYGYSFNIRQTKRAKLTERFVKISSIVLPTGEIINDQKLNEIGMEFEKLVSNSFGRDQVVQIDSSKLGDLVVPEIPSIPISQQCPSYTISLDQQSANESVMLDCSQNIAYNFDTTSYYPNIIYPMTFDGASFYYY